MARRLLVICVTWTIALCFSSSFWAARSELISEPILAQNGLTRLWYAQVEMDQGQARIINVALCDGVLYAQSNTAMVYAIDAETGKTLWSKQVGERNRPSMPLEASGDLVAVVNGSRLYVLQRDNGDILHERDVQDVPGAGPALSSKRAFVPMVMGDVVAFQVPAGAHAPGQSSKDAKNATADSKLSPEAERRAILATMPLACQSAGRVLVQPLVTRDFVGGEYVVWSTDLGYLCFGRIERNADNVLALKYRLETGGTIVARPAYLPPDPKVQGDAGVVFAASTDGFVYAIQEETGATLWRFSTGEPILQSPAVIDDRVYVTTELGEMYCLAIKTGKSLWSVDNAAQFVAAGKTRVYAADRVGRLLVFQASNGARLDAIPAECAPIKLINADTDRIYLASEGGLIQCLREIEQTKPLMHGKERKEAAKAESKPQVEKAEAPKPASEEVKPVKKEHAAPKTPATPKTPKEPKPKKELKPKKGKKGADGATPPGNAPNTPKGKNGPNNNANPF